MTWIDERIAAWAEGRTKFSSIWDALGMSQELYDRFDRYPPKWILGIDEVGCGSWAGPLVVGAVLAPYGWTHPLLRDSKSIAKDTRRAKILSQLQESPGARYFLRRTCSSSVDRTGIFKARLESYKAIMDTLKGIEPNTLIVLDGDLRVHGIDHVALPKADTFVPQVMAAALVAKVARDTEMVELARLYPQYDFESNKGYRSESHEEALKKHGPCPDHRRSFRPIKDLLSGSSRFKESTSRRSSQPVRSSTSEQPSR